MIRSSATTSSTSKSRCSERPSMSIAQYLRIIWARKWLVLALLLLTTLVGTLITTFVLSKQYTADASLVVEVRNDPVMGALAPGLASPGYLATQIELLKSDRAP